MSKIFKGLIPSLLALTLFATPYAFADEEGKAPSEAQAKNTIKKLATGYIAARKQLVCTQCVGKIRIVCTTCKGKAWKFQDNRYKRGGIDWDRSTPCPKCNKEGKRPAYAYARKVRKRGTEPRNAPGAGAIDCPKSFCTFGFNKKAAKKIFWDLRSPGYQKNLNEGLKGLNTDDIVALILITINDNAKELRAAKIKEIAGKTGVNPQSIDRILQENVNLKHNWIRPANTGKLVSHSEGNAEVEMRHYKSKERFNENVPIIWENNKAYLGIPKKKTTEEGNNGGMKEGEGKAGEGKDGAGKDGEGKEGADGEKKEGTDDEKMKRRQARKNKKKERKKNKKNRKKNSPEPAPKKPDTGNSP